MMKKKPKSDKKKLEKALDVAWSKAVRERDVTCRKCGGTGGLSAHHVYGRRHLGTRWDVDNGVTLCYPHHIHWSHRDIGGFFSWWMDEVGAKVANAVFERHQKISKYSTEQLQEILDNLTAGGFPS